MAILKDNRRYQAMTVSQADDLFLRIAHLKAAIDKETAAHRKKLADLELEHKAKISGPLAEKEALEKELAAYIMANPDRFEKPRKHPVGQIGAYGITTDPAYVTVTDKEALIAYALENGYDDLIRVERTVDKEAAFRRITAGEDLPGAEAVPAGDVAKLTFKKGYADQLEGEK
ncbi:MAG: host-nuclease inhibitor Gam family protein [Lentisphaeria bacterium]|nr:host-nuclease inhibitor Gam family protein [Lentisphaeria bacterium]